MSCLFSTKQAKIRESSKVKHLLLFFWFCLVCDANSLPVYTNGEALNSNTDTAPYFVGEEVSYTCNDGYVLNSSDDTFKCTCTASSSGCNPSWQCNPEETETTCRLRKSLCSVWQFVCFVFPTWHTELSVVFRTFLIAWSWLNFYPGCVIASLDKIL